MSSEDFQMGRIEFDKPPLQNPLSSLGDRRAIEANRQAIEEVRAMLQAVIDHLGVPYPPSDSCAKQEDAQ